MKQFKIILGLILLASVSTFAQSPRIKLNQITKDTVKGSVLISNPTDSGMVYSRDFFISYGADTVLILYGDTITGGGGLSSVLSDGVTITGDGTTGNELKADTSVIVTIKALNDSLATVSASTEADGVTITGDGTVSDRLKVDTLLIATIKALNDTLTIRGYLTAEVDGSVTNEIQDISTTGAAGNISISDGSTLNLNVDDADASATNEGSLTVAAGGANDSEIQSNTSGSSNVTIAGGSNVTVTESGQTITIASTGGGTSYNNISEDGDTVLISDHLKVDDNTLYVDATQNQVGIGTSSPSANLNIVNGGKFLIGPSLTDFTNAKFHIKGEGTQLAAFQFYSNNANNSGSFGFYRLNGTIASPSIVNDNDRIGGMFGSAYNGSTRVSPAAMYMYVDGVSGTDIGGRFEFETGTNSTRSTRMSILSNGNVGIGTTSPTSKLTVIGDIDITGSYLVNGSSTSSSTSTSSDTSTPSDTFVTISGIDTITGAKTFTSDLNIDAKIALNDGGNNIVIGDGAGASLVSGQALGNILAGTQAGAAIDIGDYNIANGHQALYSNSSGNRNVANGYQAGRYYGSGSDALTNANGSIFLGSNTRASANGNENEIVIGTNAIGNGDNSVTIGDSNNDLVVMKGRMELNDGGNSVYIGDDAGRVDDKIDNRNVGIGYQALYLNTTGNSNTANGYQALYSNTTGGGNVANGRQALYLNTTGVSNTANGYQALYSNTTGERNTANGRQALYSNTTGVNNTANGFQALRLNTTGDDNVANGYQAFYSLSSGSNNQAYGFSAGRYLSDGTTALDTANGSLFLGSGTRALANNNTNEIVIGTNAIGNGSNTITIGSSSTVSLHTRNYEFDIDQTVGASEDNYVLTYDNGDGQISLEPISLLGSATLDFGSTSAQSSADLTITVTGAADGDVVSLGVPNASVNANTNYTAWVSAANTVTVRFNNYSSGAVDPASGTFKVKVFK